MRNTDIKTMKQLNFRLIPENNKVGYYYYIPKKVEHVLVAVHGISRNAEEIIQSFKGLAEQHNVLVIAPVFRKDFAKDYQRLGRKGKGPRSDYQLMAMLSDAKKHLSLQFDKFHMFGFSAGAQFVHRFAFAHPNLVKKSVLVAAGWYTFPRVKDDYPYGLKLNDEFTDISFSLQRILRLQFKVFVGDKDLQRDSSLNTDEILDKKQGKTRVERAQKWRKAMNNKMKKHGIENTVEIEKLEGIKHQFIDGVENSKLHTKVFDWILEK